MSVLLETSAGDIVIDLLLDYAPKLCENFLKLCKIKYYNFSPLHSIQKDFSFQTGDPLGPLSQQSDGGSSIWGVISGDPSKRTFPAPFHPKLKNGERGTVGMATVPMAADPDTRLAASQFIVTLGDNIDYLDGKSAIFGKVVEGFDVLEKINTAIVDPEGHPLVDIRVKHTVILDDPFPDPDGLQEPTSSPLPSKAQLATVRIEDDANLEDLEELDPEEAEKKRRDREARQQALTLELIGDLPFAEVKPPENVLFVCKLNPVTTDEDLELIFSRFGKILSCEVIRDHKTGDSLQYAFIEFEEKEQCEAAYYKMQDVLIDDRRIHVDFSQSVSKLSDVWRSETNQKRAARPRGGWGGVKELEKWRKYRDEDDDDQDGRYDMVHSVEDMRKGHGGDSRQRSDHGAGGGRRRSGSPRDRRSGGDREWDRRQRDRDYDRRRDSNRRRESPQTLDRDRDRKSDRAGYWDRDRGRREDRYHRDSARGSASHRAADRSRADDRNWDQERAGKQSRDKSNPNDMRRRW